MLAGVVLTPLQRIPTPGGDVRHALKASDAGFAGFGEAYFSSVDRGAVKGWKRHTRMCMNLVVPVGAVRFVVRSVEGETAVIDLSPDPTERYARLTVEPGLWMAFQGRGDGLNLVLNLASIEHDPAEAEARPIEAFRWDWTDG